MTSAATALAALRANRTVVDVALGALPDDAVTALR